jgi:CDGSH-type Zn-finger protein
LPEISILLSSPPRGGSALDSAASTTPGSAFTRASKGWKNPLTWAAVLSRFGGNNTLAKPFNPRELSARIRAVLRGRIEVSGVSVDPATREVSAGGRPSTCTSATCARSSKAPASHRGRIRDSGRKGKPFGVGGRTAIALCRCADSMNKPFYDGRHKATSFESTCEARELAPPQPKVTGASMGARQNAAGGNGPDR